jgi:hypothetical protein
MVKRIHFLNTKKFEGIQIVYQDQSPESDGNTVKQLSKLYEKLSSNDLLLPVYERSTAFLRKNNLPSHFFAFFWEKKIEFKKKMNIAICIHPCSRFHHVLGFIDALPLNVNVHIYVTNENDWIGLLTQAYKNLLTNKIRKNLYLNNLDLFKFDLYDYVFFSCKQSIINNEKSRYICDILPCPVTDKLFAKRQPYLKNKIESINNNDYTDLYYLNLSSCEYLLEDSKDISLTCLVPSKHSKLEVSVEIRQDQLNSNKRILMDYFTWEEKSPQFQVIHLVNDNLFSLQVPTSIPIAQKKWELLGYNVKIWNIDDIIKLIESKYQHYSHRFLELHFLKKLIVFEQGGLVVDVNFTTLNHDGYWNIINDFIINQHMIGSFTANNLHILNDVQSEDLVVGILKDKMDINTAVNINYQLYFAIILCIFSILFYIFIFHRCSQFAAVALKPLAINSENTRK